MANIVSSRGYSSSYRGSNAPGAFYQILTSDFGSPAPAAPTLTVATASGTITSTTSNVQLTWITAAGVSLPSTSTGILVNSADGGVTILEPARPTNSAPVIGWQIYSQGSTGAPLQNVSATGTVPAPVTFVTTQGTVIGFAVNTTSVFQNSLGTGAGVPAIDRSGLQPALPTIPASGTGNATGGSADAYFIVPNSGSQWKNYKSVGVMRPDSVLETAGVTANYPFDCESPLYPGATAGATTYTQVAVAAGTYMVMNGNLFISTLATNSTAATFVGGAAFNVAKGSTVVDGSVTWLCLGKATLVHARFENAGNAAATPVAQEYDLFQL